MKSGSFPSRLLACAVLAACAGATSSPQRQCIDIKLRSEMRQTLTDSRGKPVIRLVPAEKLGEGEELFYTVSATNTCGHPVEDVVVDTPVPQHTLYVPGTAIAPAALALFSTDGGFNFAPAEAITIAVPGGQPRKAAPADYTHIRWVFRKPLQPQSVVFARFRAVVK